jgi:two-component system CheB/CheR fusion protein
MTGYQVARRLRERPGLKKALLRPAARVPRLTGYGREEDRRLTREAGFDCHLVKPVDPEALQRVLAGPAK